MSKGTLKEGRKTSEFWITIIIIAIGVLLIIYSKTVNAPALHDMAKSVSPEAITGFAKMIKDNTDEYLGAAMILLSALSYMIKRCVLKYFEIKHVIAMAQKEAEKQEEFEAENKR